VLFLLSPVKSAFPVAYQFFQVREISLVIPSGIDYFVRPAGVFEAALVVVECVLGYVYFERLVSFCFPQERMRFWVNGFVSWDLGLG
jgi:hypothetical protein